MNFKQHAIAAGLALTALFSSSAFASEPTIQQILGSDWDVVTDFSALPSWNTAGTTLKFTLASENTANASTQTFSIYDGSSFKSIFSSSATSSTAPYIYTLTSGITNVVFSGDTTPEFYIGASNLYTASIQVWTNGTSYALGFEDWTDHDFQDMVVTISAVPEPETYAMLLAGLGLMGFVARRKQQK